MDNIFMDNIWMPYWRTETVRSQPFPHELFFAKVHPNAKIPTKKLEDAGYDIYACFDEDYIVIAPGETKMIPTGIASAMGYEKYIQIEERGSTGSKGMKKSAGIIDSGYRDEWFVAITNCNKDCIIISKLDRDELIETHSIAADEFPHSVYIPFNDTDKCYLAFYNPFNGEPDDCGIIYPYEKAIAQAIVHTVHEMHVQEVDYETLLGFKSERGTGKLGSSEK